MKSISAGVGLRLISLSTMRTASGFSPSMSGCFGVQAVRVITAAAASQKMRNFITLPYFTITYFSINSLASFFVS